MAKGASGPPRPVRLTVDVDAEGEQQASISVGPFVSEMDEAERQREKHETKRLLYVALTRARDRLYLASALKDGVLVPGRGSLARSAAAVDPGPLREGRAVSRGRRRAAGPVDLDQRVGRGRSTWRVCRPASTSPAPHERRVSTERRAASIVRLCAT